MSAPTKITLTVSAAFYPDIKCLTYSWCPNPDFGEAELGNFMIALCGRKICGNVNVRHLPGTNHITGFTISPVTRHDAVKLHPRIKTIFDDLGLDPTGRLPEILPVP